MAFLSHPSDHYGYDCRSHEHESFLAYLRHGNPERYEAFIRRFSEQEFYSMHPREFNRALDYAMDHYRGMRPRSEIDYSRGSEPYLEPPRERSTSRKLTWLEEMQAEINQWLQGIQLT